MKMFSKVLMVSSLVLAPTLMGGESLSFADQPAAGAAPGAAQGAAPNATPPAAGSAATASPQQAPQVGTFRVTEVGGGLGGSESGFNLGANATVEAQDFIGSVELSMGQPILRLRGRAEAIPIRLVTHQISGSADLEVSFVPINGDFQVSLPSAQDHARHFIRISPEVRARLQVQAPHEIHVRLQALAAPVSVGVARDGDGAGAILTTRVGAGVEVEAPVGPGSLSVFLQGASSPSWLSGLGDGSDVRAGAQYDVWSRAGQQYYVRLEHASSRLDVRPSEGRNVDSGQSSQTMLSVGARF